MLLEVCVDSVESAINAENGGASRLELCSALSVGGLTPSVGLLQILKQYVKIPIMCMLRPRDGDFTYTPQEMEVILADLTALSNAGSDGFVFGALLNTLGKENSCPEQSNAHGILQRAVARNGFAEVVKSVTQDCGAPSTDFIYKTLEQSILIHVQESLLKQSQNPSPFIEEVSKCSIQIKQCLSLLTCDIIYRHNIVETISPQNQNFHFLPAFDLVDDMKNALDMIISLGFHRVLTSGQKTTALEGCETISQLVQMAKERIVIMPGSGITTSNITQLVELTCAKEYHGSFSEVRRSVFKSGSSTIKMGNDDNSDKKVTTTANVRIAVDILKLLS